MIRIIFFTPYGNICVRYGSPHLSFNLSVSNRIGQEVTRKRFILPRPSWVNWLWLVLSYHMMPLIHSCLPTEREWRRRDLAGFKLLWRSSVDVEWPENAIVCSVFRFSAQSLPQMDCFFFIWGVFAWTVHTHVHQRGTALTCGHMCFCYHMWGIPWFPHSCFFCFFLFRWHHNALNTSFTEFNFHRAEILQRLNT